MTQASIRDIVAKQVRDKQWDIIKRLIAQYRSGQLTNDQLRGTMGEISALEAVLEDLSLQARRSTEEEQRVMRNG